MSDSGDSIDTHALQGPVRPGGGDSAPAEPFRPPPRRVTDPSLRALRDGDLKELRVESSTASFREGGATPVENERLLTTRIKDLALRIVGTKVERMVEQLYQELEAVGISLRPICYLSDEWGCPDGKPLIGIPFYLADEKLGAIEGEINEVREDERESMMYLRHEAGHAFCYAHELYKRDDFRQLFGPFTRPYVDDYKVQPFSRSYVRHIAGWYAQKHPDEDFAETFAIHLTPGLDWREQYKGWPALKKLEYVEARIKEFGRAPPIVQPSTPDIPDVPVEAIEETVGEHFRREGPPDEVKHQLEAHLDGELRHLFEARQDGTKAAELIEGARKQLIPDVSYWTGLARPVVKALVLHLIDRARSLDLRVKPGGEQEALAKLAVFVTTLCMNRVYSGRFIEL